MKMYIMISENCPDHFAPVAAAHASLACYLKYKDDISMELYLKESFKKVVVRGSSEDFKSLEVYSASVITESALDGMTVAMVFHPDLPRISPDIEKRLKKLKLWKPS